MKKKIEDYIDMPLVMANAIRVVIPPSKRWKINKAVKELCAVKLNETQGKKDPARVKKYYLTSLLGIAAMEEYFKGAVVEGSTEYTQKYNCTNISGTSVGIKTIPYGKLPLIRQKNSCPQVICLLSPIADNEVWICGLATVDVLNRYQDKEYTAHMNTKKVAFYGLANLLPIPPYDELTKKYPLMQQNHSI